MSIYPIDLKNYLQGLPFLGELACSHSNLIAGSEQEIVLTYKVGASGLADGAWLKIAFRFYSDWGLFQTSQLAGRDYLTVDYIPRAPFSGESSATVRSLQVRFDQKGHERPFQKAIIVDVIDGYLNPGDRIEVRLGDRRRGGPGTRVQTFVENAFRFRGFVDTSGTSRFAPVPGDVKIDIAAGPPKLGVLLAPRLVRPETPFPVTFRLEDAWGNAVPSEHLDDVTLHSLRNGQREKAWSMERNSNQPLACSHAILQLDRPGEVELVVERSRDGDRIEGRTWVQADPQSPVPRALYADLHIHSDDTVGTNDTRTNLGYARNAAALDIAGYTANDFNIRNDDWIEAVRLCREFTDPGRVLCFPGTEWCGNSSAGGDRNVVFLGEEVRFPEDREGRSLRVFDWNEHSSYKSVQQPQRWPVSELFDAYRDLAEKTLLIPHVGGRRAVFDWHDPDLERLVEVASSWGHFDWFYQEALARGLKVGVSAAGDEHRGRPGGGAPGVGSFGVHGGLTGVLAEELTPSSVARALRSRRTWATTGGRQVALLRSGTRLQGDEFTSSGPLDLSYELYGESGWEHIELRDQKGVFLERNLHSELGYAENRFRIRWGGARIRDRYRWAAWFGHIEIKGTEILSWTARGLEHPEEKVVQTNPGEFRIRTDTYGDADHVEIEVADMGAMQVRIRMEIDAYNKTGDPLSRNPDPRHPGTDRLFTGEYLWTKERIAYPLGGADLFVCAERVTQQTLPRQVLGSFRLAPASFSKIPRAVYLFARERDDSKVWTSPLFIEKIE
jgi:hypothetical protein